MSHHTFFWGMYGMYTFPFNRNNFITLYQFAFLFASFSFANWV